ncbi:MAG: glycosyltransferase [Gammaproteobacteria bacterium]
MIPPVEISFWFCAGLVVYTYALYPLALALLASTRNDSIDRNTTFNGSISFVLVAHNEETRIGQRIVELSNLLRACGGRGEIVVVSDGSTDTTAEVARSHASSGVRVMELPHNIGKAAALTHGCSTATGDILIFADARQRWAADAVEKLIRNFSNAAVGAVGGELVIERVGGLMAGVGLYWRYEKWLRRTESRVHSTVGLSGAIAAVRRALFCSIPPNTVLDDVYWPLRVTMKGYRVIHEDAAKAFDRPSDARGEFRRKVRTLAGNFQLIARLPSALLPYRNPIWICFISHKVLRLLVPWALIVTLLTSFILPGPFYFASLIAQVAFYVFGMVGLATGRSSSRWAAAAGSFLLLNVAAWVGFWVWLSGGAEKSWRKTHYKNDGDELGPA